MGRDVAKRKAYKKEYANKMKNDPAWQERKKRDSKRYHARHKSEANASVRDYYHRNKELIALRRKKRRIETKDDAQKIAKSHAYYLKTKDNPHKIENKRQNAIRYRQAHKNDPHRREVNKKSRIKWKDKIALANQRIRRARWMQTIISNATSADRRNGRTWIDGTYIDIPFLEKLHDDQESKCIYCHMMMLYGENIARTSADALSIQRMDNDLAHIKTNSLFACLRCNMVAKYIPHTMMLLHGANLRDHILRYCSFPDHVGDRVVAPEEIAQHSSFCQPCERLRRQSYQNPR